VAGTQVVSETYMPSEAVAAAASVALEPGPRRLSALGVTLLLVGVGGVVPWERRRRRLEREEEERQERDRALSDLFHGDDMLDDPEPDDDWVSDVADDGPYATACDALFSEGETTWFPGRSCGRRVPVECLGGAGFLDHELSELHEWGAEPRDAVCARGVSTRRSRIRVIRAIRGQEEAPANRWAAAPARRHRLLSRSSVVWLAACTLLGVLFLGWGAALDGTARPNVASTDATTSQVAYRTRDIEDLRKGDMVVAWDRATGRLGRHEVANTFVRTATQLRILEFAAPDGSTQTLETTDEHPFWSVGDGNFVAAGKLHLGDQFISPAGELSTLVSTASEPHPEGVTVYNFEVSGVHNYYVRADGLRAPPVRVHNAQGYVPPSGKPPIRGPVRPYDEAQKNPVLGYDNHHLDPRLGRSAPDYRTGPTVGVRNDNAGGRIPGGINLHTGKGGFQTALRQHITKDLGFTIKDWSALSDAVRQLHLRRYYASFGIPFPM
jgi:hypothetical protein